MRISDWSSDVCSSDLGSWQKNYFSRPGDEFGKRREFAGRITLDWKPTDRLSFMASLSGWHDGNEPQKIGRASCRERVCQYVYISVDAESLKKNKEKVEQIGLEKIQE